MVDVTVTTIVKSDEEILFELIPDTIYDILIYFIESTNITLNVRIRDILAFGANITELTKAATKSDCKSSLTNQTKTTSSINQAKTSNSINPAKSTKPADQAKSTIPIALTMNDIHNKFWSPLYSLVKNIICHITTSTRSDLNDACDSFLTITNRYDELIMLYTTNSTKYGYDHVMKAINAYVHNCTRLLILLSIRTNDHHVCSLLLTNIKRYDNIVNIIDRDKTTNKCNNHERDFLKYASKIYRSNNVLPNDLLVNYYYSVYEAHIISIDRADVDYSVNNKKVHDEYIFNYAIKTGQLTLIDMFRNDVDLSKFIKDSNLDKHSIDLIKQHGTKKLISFLNQSNQSNHQML